MASKRAAWIVRNAPVWVIAAGTLIQAGSAVLHHPLSVAGSGVIEPITVTVSMMFCLPTGCNGFQPYEWVLIPLLLIAFVLTLPRLRGPI